MAPPHNSGKVGVVEIIIALFVVVILALVAYLTAGTGNGIKTGGPQPPSTAQNMLVGTVEKISGQEITLNNVKKLPEIIPATAAQSENVIVSVDQATRIERFVTKDGAVLTREQTAYSAAAANLQAQGAESTTTPLRPPEPFTRVGIALTDVRVGDVIVASSNDDISKASAFTATMIEVQIAPLASVAVAPTVVSDTRPAPPLPAGAR